MKKIKAYILAHKVISTIVVLAVVYAGYWGYKKTHNTSGVTLYVEAPATTGTIVSSITGTGQVAALNQVNIQPQVSGLLTSVDVQPGEAVGDGRLLFTIDNTSAVQAVTDAQANLESAQINLNKLQIQDSQDNLNSTLTKGYDDGFSTVTNTFLDLPGIMSGLNDMFFTGTISKNGQWNIDWYQGEVSAADTTTVLTYKQNFTDAYNAALAAYNANFSDYKSASRASDNATIDALTTETYNTVKLISSAIKSANNYIDFVNTSLQENPANVPPAIIAANVATLNTYTSETNTDVESLLSSETEIQSDKEAFDNSDLDIQSSQLSITQAQNALQEAKNNLAYYSITAPFGGIIASVPVQKGQNVGSGTTLATIITTQQIATISLNEVDVSKIQLGDKVTVTFDAIPDLTTAGTVSEIDSLGTVSQGVVDYNIQISFDTNDSRVKPGMSVNAAIITNVAQDVLTVPNSAIKTTGGTSYVQVFATPLPAPVAGAQGSPSLVPPTLQPVTIGVADNTSTQILSGLNAGDEVVTRTIAPTAASATASTAPSILGATGVRTAGGIGGGGFGGGATRAPATAVTR